MNKRNWTLEEDNYILNNAHIKTWQEMASFLGCSISTVMNRAKRLGIEINHTTKDRWTKEEVDLLKEYSKKYIGKTIAKKLNKSYVAVKKKAKDEGIKLKFKTDIWKKWMIYYLKDNIGKQTIRQIALFLELTPYQVRKKCEELGLEYENNRWTKDEEKILIDNALNCHYSELTKLLPRKSKSAILCKARSMNIDVITESIDYSDDTAKYIVDNWGKVSINEMSRVLCITRSRIYLYQKKYNLPKLGQKTKWTQDNINKLRSLATSKSIDELAHIFKSTRASIKTVASNNNIRLIDSKKKYTDEYIDNLKVLAKDHTINEMCTILNIKSQTLGALLKRFKIVPKKEITKNWTKEEIDLLKSITKEKKFIYEIMNYIDKTDVAIVSKCKELNIDYNPIPRREWTKGEVLELINDAKAMNIKELVIKYKRTSSSIKMQLKRNNVKLNSLVDYWMEDDVILLRKLVDENKSISEIASILNRTTTAVELKIKRENIELESDKRYWTNDEVVYLEDNWDEHTITYLSKKLNRTQSSITHKAFELGLGKQFFHPEALTIREISEIFNVRRIEIDTTWIILGLPYKVQRVTKSKSYKYVVIEDLFNFLEKNQFLYDGKDFEENILGVEPEWVKIKRKHDFFEGFDNSMLRLKKKQLLQQKKYFLEQLKEEKTNIKILKK